MARENLDSATVEGFGREWSSFSHADFPERERKELLDRYFRIFPWDKLPKNAVGADIGCGSGRWAVAVAPKVGKLHLVDASQEALAVAKRNLAEAANTEFHHRSVGELAFPAHSLDFAYSLGVLHHVPDTKGAIRAIARALKPGAPFLIYLYYSLDNRPLWFRLLWKGSDLVREGISRLPYPLRYAVSQLIAAGVYFPLARAALLLEKASLLPRSFPLAFYRKASFYVMRTDALDRFGTRLEQRFSRQEVQRMLEESGFREIRFSEEMPHWVAVATRTGEAL